MQSCPSGYQCTALSRQQLATNFGAQLNVSVGDLGVCAYAPQASRSCMKLDNGAGSLAWLGWKCSSSKLPSKQ